MTQAEFCGMLDRLCRLACAECVRCASGEEPTKHGRYWRHGRVICTAAATHDRITEVEALGLTID